MILQGDPVSPEQKMGLMAMLVKQICIEGKRISGDSPWERVRGMVGSNVEIGKSSVQQTVHDIPVKSHLFFC